MQELRTHFRTRAGVVRAVDGVSFALEPGGSLGIVGESGSGKTVTSLSIMRLLEPPGFVAGGRVLFRGRDMVGLVRARRSATSAGGRSASCSRTR